MIKTKLDNEQTIQDEWRAAGLEGSPPKTLRQCNERLRAIKKDIGEIGKGSFLRREQERKQKIESLASSTEKRDLEQAKRLRQLQRAEAINQIFKKLRALQQTTQKTGVTRRTQIHIHVAFGCRWTFQNTWFAT